MTKHDEDAVLTTLWLASKALEDCKSCQTIAHCRIMLESAIKITKDNINSLGKNRFMVFTPGCGKTKRISIRTIKELE